MAPIPIPTRTLRDYFASLPNGAGAGVVDRQLVIRTDLATGSVNSVSVATANGFAGVSDGDPSTPTLTISTTLGSGQVPVGNGAGGFQSAPVTGAGNIVLSIGATLVGTNLGSPATLVGTNITGTATGLTSGISLALKSATTTVDVSAATAPTSGQVLTATGGAAATWQTPAASGPRVVSVASTATLTPNANTTDLAAITAQAVGLAIAAPTGSPVDGQHLTIRIRDNGTARAIAWNAIYTAWTPTDLRVLTVITKTLLFDFVYNSTETQWQLLHSNASVGIWS